MQVGGEGRDKGEEGKRREEKEEAKKGGGKEGGWGVGVGEEAEEAEGCDG